MSKIWVVIKCEYSQVVKKKSFIIGILLIPVLMAAFGLLPALLATKSASSTQYLAVVDQTGESVGEEFKSALDHYKLDDGETPYYEIHDIIEITPGDSATFVSTVDSLTSALNDEEIKYFLIFKQGIEEADSNMALVTNSESFRTISRFERIVSRIASTMRLKQSNVNLSVDSILALTKRVNLPRRDAQGDPVNFETKYFASMIFISLIMFVIIGYGQVIMRSVIEEKTSRIMEVLVSSITPFQLMLGKVFGLGGATLTQLFIWMLMGAGLYFGSGAFATAINPGIAKIVFNPVVLTFFCLFLIFGYLMFATLFALLGSIVNSEKEAQNFVMPLTMLLVVPFVIGIAVIQEPNSEMARTLSMIPFFAPTLMMMRIIFVAPSVTEYSFFSGILGEAILSFVLLLVATFFVIWLSARIFRIGILMYGKRPTLPEIIKWVRY